ncbi:uncharacterized protein [Panulirus ornatus]|uniref:uncharacterized protein isoform X2 n=1 Tax=Panulirus ornatus TaxID=150431 RepID=UPI003A8556FE
MAADPMTSFLSSLDGSLSRVTKTERMELTTSAHTIRGYSTFQSDKVRGAVNLRQNGKWNPVNVRKGAGRGKGSLGQAKRVVRGLCARGIVAREEEADEEAWLLGDDHRRRGSQSPSQHLEEHEQKPGIRSGGVRVDGALRQQDGGSLTGCSATQSWAAPR